MADDGEGALDAERKANFEQAMYRRSLRRVVEFMNKTLEKPASADAARSRKSTSSEWRATKVGRSPESYKTPNTKKKTKRLIKEAGDYSVADVRPTRIKKDKPREAPQERKGRVNKYSELKRNDTIKRRKDFRSAGKSPKRE